MSIRLRGGHKTSDPRLDRIPQFDPRSKKFPVRAVLPDGLRSRSWPCAVVLDQGQEGSCVGHGFAHELIAQPAVAKGIDHAYAVGIYDDAKKVDDIPGTNYEGTSVLAGAKVCTTRGWFSAYRWAGVGSSEVIDDVALALAHEGPVVLGIPWLDTMFDPQPNGLLDCSGAQAGGHCILARGVLLKKRLRGEAKSRDLVRLRNSWGPDWGLAGDAFIDMADLERLLKLDGEGCVPMGRKTHASV